MPSERELDQAAADLQRFRIAQNQHVKSQNEILQQYHSLLRDYRRLQSDYDEARDSRDNYKKLSKGTDRDPFVLVLIDGDGYVFNDDLISSGVEGGAKAAQQLQNAVKRSLMVKGLDDCNIMVRIYANVARLSRALSKEKLCGPEKRSVATFIASFNRANDLFDFVDAGESNDSANLKIRAQFRQFIDNAQCRHIFFAGCHDLGYMNDITPHISKQERITLLRNHAFQEDFQELGLPDEQLLPNVFRRSPLADQALAKPAKPAAPVPVRAKDLYSEPEEAPICVHFSKGRCDYGSSCKYRHVRAPIDDIKNWRQKTATPAEQYQDDGWDQSPVSARPDSKRSMAQEFDARFNSGGFQPRRNESYGSGGDALSQSSLTRIEDLPRPEDPPEGKIAVNADGHRLDPYIIVNPAERATFTAVTKTRKLCNDFFLTNNCPHPNSCKYDHEPITESLRNCLRQAALNTPCRSKNGSCRDLGCNYGHVCQRSECKFRGGRWLCRHKPEAHTIDFTASDFVDGERQGNGIASYSTRSHSMAADAWSDHGSQQANGGAESHPKAEADDDIEALVDTVRAGPTQEAVWAAEEEAEPEPKWEPESEPKWESEPKPVPEPARKSKWKYKPEPEADVAPPWDGQW